MTGIGIDGLPRWAVMWLLAGVLFGLFKALTWSAARAQARRVAVWRSAAYLLGWVGLDPKPFLAPAGTVGRPGAREWIAAVLQTLSGAGLLWLALPRLERLPPLVRSWIGLLGLAFLLHFGLFRLLALFWRRLGIAVRPIMNNPTAAASLAELWGRRWNLAFRDLTHRFLFQPVCRRHGPGVALMAVFLGSGLVHDLVISLPAGGGWGLPTLYFTLQGAGVLAQRSAFGAIGSGAAGRIFTLAVAVLPAPLLFHPPFLRQVALPFLGAIGAL